MRQSLSPHILIIVAVLTAAFALRVGAAFWWQSRVPAEERFMFGDSASYWMLAQSIYRGEPYQYGGGNMYVFRAPGYPLLLAGLFSIVGDDPSPLWARGLGAVFGTLSVAGILWLGWALFDLRVGILAGVLAAIYPGAIGMSVFVLSEAAFCPLFVAQFICWTLAVRAATESRLWTWSIAGGIAAGLATLIRPSWLLFTPAAVALAVLIDQRHGRQARIGILMCCALAATMLPWWLRNYRVTGRFVPTTLQVGASLYDGWNPQATGASDMRFVEDFRQRQRAWDAQQPGPLADTYEYRLDQRYRRAAIHWARENPGRVLSLAGRKLLRMWSPWPHAAEMQSWTLRLATVLGFVPLAIFGVWGAVRYCRRGWPYVLCLLPAGYFTLLHMVFASSIRYRQPAMLSVIVLAASSLGSCLWSENFNHRNTDCNDQLLRDQGFDIPCKG
jgi:4-amino-4-deoxy-L-arabinose transferase-like glycosyltransferase